MTDQSNTFCRRFLTIVKMLMLKSNLATAYFGNNYKFYKECTSKMYLNKNKFHRLVWLLHFSRYINTHVALFHQRLMFMKSFSIFLTLNRRFSWTRPCKFGWLLIYPWFFADHILFAASFTFSVGSVVTIYHKQF